MCGRSAGDAFACATCAETARKDLTNIADLARFLDGKRARVTTNWKPGTIGRAAHIPLPYDPRVSWVADPILTSLRATAGLIRATPYDDTIPAIALWLIAHCEWLRRQEVGPEEFAMFDRASAGLFLLFDRPPDTHYIGPCGATSDLKVCTRDLYIGEGITALLCPSCNALHQVSDRQEQLDESVANYLGTAKEISALCRHQFGDDVSTAMIRGYVRHGMIQTKGSRVDQTTTGDRVSALFRIGDVREAVGVLSRDVKRHRKLKREASHNACA
jgi:hypothetical protein